MNTQSKVHAHESMDITLLDIGKMLDSSELIGNAGVRINRLQMDSRKIESGDIFLALKGERFDAHEFLADIAKIPNISAVVQKSSKTTVEQLGMNAVLVEDTKEALGELAKAWRAKNPIPLIAVTGSNGKTTVTQMIASILRAYAGDDSLATEGNLNNDIGLPQTLLRLRENHLCAVVELGMNHPGEIEYLAGIAQPNVCLVNNAQREHQEFMNTVEAVAIENGQVINALNNSGVAVFPADDEFTNLWVKMCGSKPYLTFSDALNSLDSNASLGLHGQKANIQLIKSAFVNGEWALTVNTPAGIIEAKLQIAGEHNVKNALAAITCCVALKVPLSEISKGLSQFRAVKGRSRLLKLNVKGLVNGSNVQSPTNTVTLDVIDDTYNANPDSVIAAINVLSQMSAPRLLILGDMGEVGEDGPEYHQEVGEYAASKGINSVFGLGDLTLHTVQAFNKKSPQSAHETGIHYSDMDTLINGLSKVPSHFKSVLVKGSRFMKMERSVQALESFQEIQIENKQVQQSAQNKESTCC